jgi:1-acyl-sn-glycerol-3-phosphate acyltransferase
MLVKLFAALVLYVIKFLTLIFYRVEAKWLTPPTSIRWDELKLIIALNHTSLFEFLFVAALPNPAIWKIVRRLVVPIADTTLARPFVGLFFKILVPQGISITRRRDDSWAQFIKSISPESLILIFPEGRMKRRDGLDKDARPMNIKGGVAEILDKLTEGQLLIGYSGGLHHVQAPGDRFFRIFKTIRVHFEVLDIAEYKKSLPPYRKAVVQDLELRMKKNTPVSDHTQA